MEGRIEQRGKWGRPGWWADLGRHHGQPRRAGKGGRGGCVCCIDRIELGPSFCTYGDTDGGPQWAKTGPKLFSHDVPISSEKTPVTPAVGLHKGLAHVLKTPRADPILDL